MKSLILNGYVRPRGNTYNISQCFLSLLSGDKYIVDETVETCSNCKACYTTNRCIKKDKLSEYLTEQFDYIFIFSSVYFFGLNAKAKAMLDRLYSYPFSESTTIVLVTVSGSETDDLYSGVNLIKLQFSLIKEYCGYKDLKYINFVTDDTLVEVDENKIKEFIEDLL